MREYERTEARKRDIKRTREQESERKRERENERTREQETTRDQENEKERDRESTKETAGTFSRQQRGAPCDGRCALQLLCRRTVRSSARDLREGCGLCRRERRGKRAWGSLRERPGGRERGKRGAEEKPGCSRHSCRRQRGRGREKKKEKERERGREAEAKVSG